MAKNWTECMALAATVIVACYIAGVTFYKIDTLVNSAEFSATFAVFLALTLWTLILVVFTEPGYLPTLSELKRVYADPALVQLNKQKLRSLDKAYWKYYCGEDKSEPMEHYSQYIHETPVPAITFHECVSCRLYKPSMSTAHCREDSCRRCVLGKDHHCFFLATCIGDRNRSNFVAFLLSASISVGFSLGMLVINIINVMFRRKGPRFDPPTVQAELALLAVYFAFLILRAFVFSSLFNHKQNFQISFIVHLYGFCAILFGVTVGNVPALSGLVAFVNVTILFWILPTLSLQISQVRKVQTVRDFIRNEARAENAKEVAEDRQPLVKTQEERDEEVLLEGAEYDEEISWFSVCMYVIKGFYFTSIGSSLLELTPQTGGNVNTKAAGTKADVQSDEDGGVVTSIVIETP